MIKLNTNILFGKESPSSQLILILVITTFVSRIIFSYIYIRINGFENFVDSWEYYSYANGLLKQGFLLEHPEQTYGQGRVGPGLPFIIAACIGVMGNDYFILVIVLNCLAMSLGVYYLYKLTSNHIEKKVAILAAIWGLTYFEYFRYSPTLLKENWLILLIIVFIYYFINFLKENKINKHFFIFIITYLILVHFDERYISFLIIILLVLVFERKNRASQLLKQTLLILGLLIIGFTPWTIRNYIVYNQFVLLTPRSQSFTKFLFNKPTIDISNNYTQHPLVLNGQISAEDLRDTDSQITHRKEGEKIQYLKGFISPIMSKGIFVTENKYTKWSLIHNLFSLLQYGILLPFFILALYFAIKSKNRIVIYIFLFVLFHICMHVFLLKTGIQRYRLPIDSLIIATSVWGAYTLLQRNKRKI